MSLEKDRAQRDLAKIILDERMYLNEKHFYRKSIEDMLNMGYYLKHETIFSKIELENFKYEGK